MPDVAPAPDEMAPEQCEAQMPVPEQMRCIRDAQQRIAAVMDHLTQLGHAEFAGTLYAALCLLMEVRRAHQDL